MAKHKIKHFDEVFSDEFMEFLKRAGMDEVNKSHLRLIMEKIEDHEKHYDLEFVAFYSSDYIIFKHLNNG